MLSALVRVGRDDCRDLWLAQVPRISNFGMLGPKRGSCIVPKSGNIAEGDEHDVGTGGEGGVSWMLLSGPVLSFVLLNSKPL